MAVITLAEAKTQLNISASGTDTALQAVIDDATDICERRTGSVWVSRTITSETRNGTGGTKLQLRYSPVTAVATVTESGVTLTAGTDYVLNGESGILYRGDATSALAWEWGRQNIVVTYTAGPIGSVPGHIRRGLLLQVQHMWETQRGGSGGPRQVGADAEWDPKTGYTIPRRVLEAWGLTMPPALVG